MLDPTISRVIHSGAWIVSDIIGGHWVTRTYYGYSSDQALRLFVDEFGSD